MKNQGEKDDVNTIKDDVYSLGVTLKEVCLLGEVTTKSIGIKKIFDNYGDEIVRLIEVMTNQDEEERLDFCSVLSRYKKMHVLTPERPLRDTKIIQHKQNIEKKYTFLTKKK